MHDDRIDTLRRAAEVLRGLSTSLPRGPWNATENTVELADESGCVWDPDTHWVEAPGEPEETRTVALAYGNLVADLLPRVEERMLRALAALLEQTANEHEGMRRSALYLDVSHRQAAERLRRGPFGLNAALAVAMAVLGELDNEPDTDDKDGDLDD